MDFDIRVRQDTRTLLRPLHQANGVVGKIVADQKVLREAKETAVYEMQQYANSLGANAVVGVDLDYETVGSGGSMLMVTASGTAVVLE